MPGNLVKAKIETLPGEGPSLSVEAWFNPKEYQVSKSVSWNAHKASAKDRPMVQYTTGQPKKLTVELFFDGYEDRQSVRGACEDLIKMAEMSEPLHRPPECLFSWEKERFPGVIDSVSIKYTMFLSDGVPVRATASIAMQNAQPKRVEEKEKHGESPDHAKIHTVRRGESLHSIAAREYEDSGEWRRIADANGIDNPLAVEPGTQLIIPPILRV